MSTIVVTGDATLNDSVLPSDTPVSSVMGTDMSVKDTPRTVTEVSSALLKDANVQNLADFDKVAPSAYSTDQFGVASVPVIRGQLAEVYVNGMQRTTRGDGPPTNFNAYESANVVAGPASSVYGPTANVGGYVDLITKQPYFDKFHSETDFTYGSYDTKKWTEDFGGPITKELAYRVSYYGNYSGSYYNNEKTNENDAFVALSWIPSKDFTVDFNSDFYDGRFNENTGWNRPTQGLIDGNQYSTGSVTALGSAGFAPGIPAPASGSLDGVITSPGTTTLSKQATLVSPNDSDFGKDLNCELKETYVANDNLSFVNHTYYEYFELRNTEYGQLYVNAQDSNIVQDRFETHINFDIPIDDPKQMSPTDPKDMKSLVTTSDPLTFKNQIVTGVAGKYVNAIGYGDFFNEYLNATDLTTGTFPTVANQTNGTNFYALGQVPGKNFFATPGDIQPNTYTESAYEVSAFFQHEIDFTPQWTLIYSGRLDAIFDSLGNPVSDPGNPPFGAPGNPSAQNILNTSQVLGTGDVSVTYKPTTWLTAYTTFDFNESTAGNSAGGFDTYTNGAQSVDYHYKNFLYEGGLKVDLLNHTLYGSVDGFYQTHNQTTALGSTSEVRTVGAEVSTTYQPNKNFYITTNESYLHAQVVDPGAEFTQNVYDAFAPGSVGVQGTGVGSPNFAALPKGHYREGGLPSFLFSGTANYKLDCGLGASLGYVITDPIPTDELGNVWIPWQYELDASVFYTYHDNFTAKLALYNITDQENFSTGGFVSNTGGDLITVHEPFHMEGTLTYKF